MEMKSPNAVVLPPHYIWYYIFWNAAWPVRFKDTN